MSDTTIHEDNMYQNNVEDDQDEDESVSDIDYSISEKELLY